MRTFLALACGILLLCAGASAQSASSPVIAFTFDDLPAHGSLPPGVSRVDVARSILDTLKQEKLPPVYGFMNGYHLDEEPASAEVLTMWRGAGQPLGNHSFSHPNLETMTAADFEADIAKNEPLLEKYAPGTDWHWFRYPYLHEGETAEKHAEVQSYLKTHGYKVAEVTLDFEDYLWNAPYARCMAKHDDAHIAALHDSYLAIADEYISTYRAISRRLYGREIPYVLLMHIGAFDAKMLPDLIALFRARGFQFTTLEKAEADPAYAHDPGIGMAGGGALQELELKARHMPFPPNAKPYKELDSMCR